MNNTVSKKFIVNVRNDRDIELVTTEAGRIYMVSEPNCRTTNIFSDNLLIIEIKRTQILINKPFYLGLSILEISKIRNQNMVNK